MKRSALQADPKSEVFPEMTLGENKVSYVVWKGLYPYFHEQLINDVRGAPAYTIFVDFSSRQGCEIFFFTVDKGRDVFFTLLSRGGGLLKKLCDFRLF